MYNLDTEIVKTIDEISSVLSALAANDARLYLPVFVLVIVRLHLSRYVSYLFNSVGWKLPQ